MNLDVSQRSFRGENGRDEFKREQVAEKVIKLLTSEIEISPMVIDGDWGMGKTEFCHKLIKKMAASHSSYKLIYVDAFNADHADNPLMTILSSVLAEITDKNQKDKLMQKALPVLRYGLEAVAKGVVSHLLRQNADDLIEGLDNKIQDAADKAIDASVKSLLKDHEKAEENLAALQSALKSIAESSPIVIFIDELDRCRPDYAVQMLEVIKHTFKVEGLQFLLITNTKQLKAAINHRYGNQVDAQRYLEKFLKFSFRLPDFIPGTNRRGNLQLAASEHFLKMLQASATLKKTELSDLSNITYLFTDSLISLNNVSLREVETFIRYLEIYQNLSEGLDTDFGTQLLRIFGVFIFFYAPDIAESIKNDTTDANKISAMFKINGLPDNNENEYQFSYPTIFAVMLAQACKYNSSNFIENNGLKAAYWTEKINSLFRSSWGNQKPNNVFKPIKEVFICLSFGSH